MDAIPEQHAHLLTVLYGHDGSEMVFLYRHKGKIPRRKGKEIFYLVP